MTVRPALSEGEEHILAGLNHLVIDT